MLRYSTHAEKNSLYNTPACFAIYMVQLVLKWIEDIAGGLEAIERVNREKAALLYGVIDGGQFYSGTAEADSRSFMNVTFRLPDENLEKKFVAEALENGLSGLKGHRSVGGCRASIYNAVDMAAVQSLADFMRSFARKNG